MSIETVVLMDLQDEALDAPTQVASSCAKCFVCVCVGIHDETLEGPAQEAAEKLYADLQEKGVEVLLDDRNENPGVKFNDADLIGIPVRVNVGDRSLKKGVLELKVRREEERHDVPVEEVVDRVVAEIAKLQEELDAGVTEVEYKE